MSDETTKKPKVVKPQTKRLSKGFRKYLRRKKEADRKPFGSGEQR